MGRILIVDDDEGMREMLRRAIEVCGFAPDTACDGLEAINKIRGEEYDLVVTDLRIPKKNGLEVLKFSKELWDGTLVIVITAHATIESAVAAIKAGAFDYLTKPFSVDELETKVARALEQRRLVMQRDYLADSLRRTYGRLIGESPAIEEVRRLILKVAGATSPVLILGQSGTGKELVAREIHERSPRRAAAFVPVNCASLPETLIESELFGYEKGAFTGAVSRKRGKVELADGGTLFLDEIAEVPLAIQVKLLRFLQTGEYERVGGVERLHVNARIIAATNQDVQTLIKTGRFREDLYYRINVVSIKIAPLREHRDDVPALINYFLDRLSESVHKKAEPSVEFVEAMKLYDWPGNIRELENVLERALVLSGSTVLSPEDLPAEIRDFTNATTPKDEPGESESKLVQQVELLEKNLLYQALTRSGWNQSEAARELGLKRSSLQYKMRKYGLEEKP